MRVGGAKNVSSLISVLRVVVSRSHPYSYPCSPAMSAHELDHKHGEDIHPAPVALHDLERQDSLDKGVSRLDATDLVTDAEENDLKRGLAQRHVSMIALAGECPEEKRC